MYVRIIKQDLSIVNSSMEKPLRVILDCLMYRGPDSLIDRLEKKGFIAHNVPYLTSSANPIMLGHASIEIKVTSEGRSE